MTDNLEPTPDHKSESLFYAKRHYTSLCAFRVVPYAHKDELSGFGTVITKIAPSFTVFGQKDVKRHGLAVVVDAPSFVRLKSLPVYVRRDKDTQILIKPDEYLIVDPTALLLKFLGSEDFLEMKKWIEEQKLPLNIIPIATYKDCGCYILQLLPKDISDTCNVLTIMDIFSKGKERFMLHSTYCTIERKIKLT